MLIPGGRRGEPDIKRHKACFQFISGKPALRSFKVGGEKLLSAHSSWEERGRGNMTSVLQGGEGLSFLLPFLQYAYS